MLTRLLLTLCAIALSTSLVEAKGKTSTSLNGLPAPLVAKVQEIKAACGSKVMSTWRQGAHTPSGHLSNHARNRAADLQGNPECIKRHLASWPGGQSTDYWSAPGGPHVHISYNPGGMEWGLKFAHHRAPSKVRGRVIQTATTETTTRD